MHKAWLSKNSPKDSKNIFCLVRTHTFIYYLRGFTTAVQKQVQNSLAET